MLWRTTTYYIHAPAHGAGPQLTFAADGWKGSMVVYIPDATPQIIDQAKIDFMAHLWGWG